MGKTKFKLSGGIWGRCTLCAAVALVFGAVSTTGFSDATTQPASSDVKPEAPAQRPAEASGPVLDPMIAATVRDAVAGQTFQRSDIKGGAFTKHPFEEVCPDGVLIGFRIGLGSFFNTEVIKYIQPMYLTPRGEVIGNGFGDDDEVERRVEAKAPPGYAVGAVDICGGGGLDAITITYMRFNGTRIDPTDVRVTPKIGGGKNGGGLLDGDGTPIIGICGRQDDDGKFLGLGLIFVKPTAMVERQWR
jgi:hypothetical protein